MCKAFIMDPGGVDEYDGVSVVILAGHNPDLVIREGKQETERIDLTAYASTEDLHRLMEKKGFQKGTMRNTNSSCYEWSGSGECLRNPAFMEANCQRACATLVDASPDCAEWARSGECETNSKFMYGHCPVSCSNKKEL